MINPIIFTRTRTQIRPYGAEPRLGQHCSENPCTVSTGQGTHPSLHSSSGEASPPSSRTCSVIRDISTSAECCQKRRGISANPALRSTYFGHGGGTECCAPPVAAGWPPLAWWGTSSNAWSGTSHVACPTQPRGKRMAPLQAGDTRNRSCCQPIARREATHVCCSTTHKRIINDTPPRMRRGQQGRTILHACRQAGRWVHTFRCHHAA
jgi:hypothetical protein